MEGGRGSVWGEGAGEGGAGTFPVPLINICVNHRCLKPVLCYVHMSKIKYTYCMFHHSCQYVLSYEIKSTSSMHHP